MTGDDFVFEGAFENDKPTIGKYYSDETGDIFEGPFYVYVPVKGIYHYASGASYEGEMLSDHREGLGVHVYLSGDKYSGGWHNDKRNGHGELSYFSNDQYIGEWKDDSRHGHGTYYYFQSGDIFEGEWDDDEMKKGTLTLLSGDR